MKGVVNRSSFSVCTQHKFAGAFWTVYHFLSDNARLDLLSKKLCTEKLHKAQRRNRDLILLSIPNLWLLTSFQFLLFVDIYRTRTSKFLWMEERNSDIPQQLSNNHSSNSSVSDCTRPVANCCGGGGGGGRSVSCSNGSLDFSNKVTMNHLSGT